MLVRGVEYRRGGAMRSLKYVIFRRWLRSHVGLVALAVIVVVVIVLVARG